MPREQPIETFMPPNILKAKLGTAPGIDPAAIRRAEKAMEDIKTEFAQWAQADVEKLVAARARYAKAPDAEARAALLRAAHDMKGQAGTFNYPLIARVSGSLAKLVFSWPEDRFLPLSLVDAHVNAVHVIYRDKVMDESNKLALALAKELETQVAAALKT
jgi:chemotaxis protein histidine kinase CheA